MHPLPMLFIQVCVCVGGGLWGRGQGHLLHIWMPACHVCPTYGMLYMCIVHATWFVTCVRSRAAQSCVFTTQSYVKRDSFTRRMWRVTCVRSRAAQSYVYTTQSYVKRDWFTRTTWRNICWCHARCICVSPQLIRKWVVTRLHLQPIADRVAQHLEIISKTFPMNQNSPMGCTISTK